MIKTSNNGNGEVLSGPERRRRWTPVEKLALVQETYEPDMTVSLVARRHGIAPNHVLFIPEQRDSQLRNGKFELKPILKPRCWRDVITVFLQALPTTGMVN